MSAFIIAELSANHSHDINIAIKTIQVAKSVGANAVKIQTYTADTITLDCKTDAFRIKCGTLWDDKYLYQLYQEAYTPWEWHAPLRDEAERLGLLFFSTPFDFTAVDFLESMGNPIYKIASFEINDIPLIEYAASKGKPMIISTGVGTLQEIQDAVDACRRMGNNDITLLKCTSSYPAPLEKANLLTIPDMKERFGVKVGLSDHTMGSAAPVVAVALGATVIEKHFILDRGIGGPDASFSMTPDEFSEMVCRVRETEKALGTIDYAMDNAALSANAYFKRSLFVAKDMEAGEAFTLENVRSVRPNVGLQPVWLPKVIGKKCTCQLMKGTPLEENHIQESLR